jgi:hypothetical protein
MISSAEAHRLELRFYHIKVHSKHDGQELCDTLIRVSLFRDGENTGFGRETFASGIEHSDKIEWSIGE